MRIVFDEIKIDFKMIRMQKQCKIFCIYLLFYPFLLEIKRAKTFIL